MRISQKATVVWTLPSGRKIFTFVAERNLRTYVTDALGYVLDLYIARVLDDGHIGQLRKQAEC